MSVSQRVFSDRPMESTGGGILDNGALCTDEDLYEYYYATTEDGEQFQHIEPFMQYLRDYGFTHIEETWIEDGPVGILHPVTDFFLDEDIS